MKIIINTKIDVDEDVSDCVGSVNEDCDGSGEDAPNYMDSEDTG